MAPPFAVPNLPPRDNPLNRDNDPFPRPNPALPFPPASPPPANPNPPPGAEKLTRANYDKIRLGMTEDEVIAILGPPTREGGSRVRTLHWQVGVKLIALVTQDRKVISKSGANLT